MNAKEAREKALHVNISKVNSQYDEIKKKIETAANKGEYEARFYNSINLDVKNQLETDGFKVKEYDNQHEGYTLTISW